MNTFKISLTFIQISLLFFFSFLPFFRFLTKREQQLMQRRHHAQELLQWKERLDQEEAEVRMIEKEALAVWNKQQSHTEDLKTESPSHSVSHGQNLEPRPDSEKGETTEKRKARPVWTPADILTVHLFLKYFTEYVSEGDCSAGTPDSSIHTETLPSQQTGSPSSVQPPSAPETPLASIQSSFLNYTKDFVSASQSHSRRSEVSRLFSLR